MPNLIIQHFEPLCAFLLPLLLHMSQPQQCHALNVVGALLVCGSKHKTLTALTAMLRLPHADHFAQADFFRQSGWCPLEARRAVLTTQMATVARPADGPGCSLSCVSQRRRLAGSQECWHAGLASGHVPSRSCQTRWTRAEKTDR